jgi:hypothetical protein
MLKDFDKDLKDGSRNKKGFSTTIKGDIDELEITIKTSEDLILNTNFRSGDSSLFYKPDGEEFAKAKAKLDTGYLGVRLRKSLYNENFIDDLDTKSWTPEKNNYSFEIKTDAKKVKKVKRSKNEYLVPKGTIITLKFKPSEFILNNIGQKIKFLNDNTYQKMIDRLIEDGFELVNQGKHVKGRYNRGIDMAGEHIVEYEYTSTDDIYTYNQTDDKDFPSNNKFFKERIEVLDYFYAVSFKSKDCFWILGNPRAKSRGSSEEV